MPSTFDPLLRIELQATGENENTWGEKANNNFELLADAIAGHVSVAVTGSGDFNLSVSNAAVDQARKAFITLSGALTGARNIIIPSVSKVYYFRRNTSGNFAINVKTVSGAAAQLPATGVAVVVCDGVDCWLVDDVTKFSSTGGSITGFVEVSVSTSVSGPAALTITQVGAGPALVVEDAINDTSPFLIKADGAVIVGTSLVYHVEGAVTAAVQIHRNDSNAALMATTWSNSVAQPQIQLVRSKGNSPGTRGAVTTNDLLGRVVFAGDDGSNFDSSAAIVAEVAASVSASVVPGRLLLQTANTSGTLTTRVAVDHVGRVGIGTSAPQETLHVVGSLRISNAVVSAPVGAAPFQGCRAYISYDPNVPFVKRAFNVASVTKNGTGDYTITFETSLVGNNYIMIPWANGATRCIGATIPTGFTPGAARVQFRYTDNNALQDPTEFHIAFIQ